MSAVERRTMMMLPLLVELRARVIEIVDDTATTPLSLAWSVASARFAVLLGAFGDPEFLEANDDLLLALGLCGAELAFRAELVVGVATTPAPRWLDAAASLLRSIALMPAIGTDASALAGFCDGLRLHLDGAQEPQPHVMSRSVT